MPFKQIRRDYKLAQLTEDSLTSNPFNLLEEWINEAVATDLNDATAMSLITTSDDGFPESRIVLLKDYSKDGFVFFTNYKSKKAREIELNDKVGLHFFWPELERQIRISGIAGKTNTKLSKQYFHSRPQESQIAAIISEQSSVIPSRSYLDEKFKKLQEKLKGQNPDYSENWGGYIVRPVKFEFWQGRKNRLHDRVVYEQEESKWNRKRLAP